MNVLEKILEEIEEATFQEDAPIYIGNMEVDGYVRASRVKDIIRSHMNEKEKVTSAEIISRKTDGKPYYGIKYKKVGEDHYTVGYSSYYLDYVIDWLNNCFEFCGESKIVVNVGKDTNVPSNDGWIPVEERLPEDLRHGGGGLHGAVSGVRGAVYRRAENAGPQQGRRHREMTSAQTEKASSRLRRAGRARAASTARRAAAYTVLGLLCFLCLFFFYILLINATRTHFEIQRGFSLLPGRSLLTNLKSVLANANIPVLSGIRNSLLVSALSALLSVYFSALTAYGIHAYDFKFKKLAFTFILLIMMMPTQVSALGFVRLITKMGMADTLAPLFLPSIAAPVVFYFMLQYMEGNLPMEIVEAARIDGSGEFSTFNRIVLPILKPALAVQAIFTFVNTWNNYFTPALVLSSSGKKTLPILIAQLRSADFLKFDMGQVYMMVAIAILPVIAVYLCLSKFIVRGVALGGVKG